MHVLIQLKNSMTYEEKQVNVNLTVQSCKLHDKKYMIASTQITNTKMFAFIPLPVFKLLNSKVLFINRKDNSRLLFKKIANFAGKLLQNYK